MKTMVKVFCIAGVASLTATPLFAKPPGGHGTDILHFSISENVQNTGIESGASGIVKTTQNKQGNADNQKMDIVVKGLTANTTYSLFALLGSDTNLTSVTDFNTDGTGAAAIHYRSLGNGHGGGKNSAALPGALNPVSNIRELDVVNTNTIILSANFGAPDKLQYLIKRDVSGDTNGVSAELRIKATTQTTQFALTASGLADSTDYLLVFNGTPVQTNMSDAQGKLTITSASTPTSVLDLQSVALWDTSSNVVISTTLP